MIGFMQPHMTPKMHGYEIETTHGIWYLPEDVCGRIPDDMQGDDLLDRVRDYVEGEPQQVTRVFGYFGRLSAPGYMDCTDWEFSTNKRDMERGLKRSARIN